MNHVAPISTSRARQRGVVLIFCLIILVILLTAGVAVIRSSNSTLFGAGNLAFKRDLLNQGEQALSHVMAQFKESGALGDVSALQSDSQALNYRASLLETNAQGIPSKLLGTDAQFQEAVGEGPGVGLASNDLTGATSDVKIRYLIERMCLSDGVPSSATCVQSESAPTGGTAKKNRLNVQTATVYRLTVRVTGPRATQVFVQNSFTALD